MVTCTSCQKQFDEAFMRMTETGQVCETCYQPPEAPSLSKRLGAYSGLAAGLVPFFIHFSWSSSHSENGVGSATVINPVAGVFGLIALVAGGLAIRSALSTSDGRNKKVAIAVLTCLLGLYQLMHAYQHVAVGS